MRRQSHRARTDWCAKVEAQGLLFHTNADKPYWYEDAYYEFDKAEASAIEAATADLHERCLEAVQYVIDENRFAALAIPAKAVDAIKWSWEAEPPSLYGRFDFAMGGSEPKLLEYNADTPTSLLEAAVIQWQWLKDEFPSRTQFNWIWEALMAKWADLKAEGCLPNALVHFACDGNLEDLMTITALRDTAEQSVVLTEGLFMEEIGWDENRREFVDRENRTIETIFKLYPWEWLLDDTFGDHVLETYRNVNWIEPIWKMVLSNKGILAILWEMFPEHPNLLPAYLGRSHDLDAWVRKPLFSREGANITIKRPGEVTRSEGIYGAEGHVYQSLAPMAEFDGITAVVGSWYVMDQGPCGLGVRESDGPITDNWARFVPHLAV